MIPRGSIVRIERYGAGDPAGPEVTVKVAAHTPALSLFIGCESCAELERAYHGLLDGDMALMPLGNYGFSQRFGWVQDKYGVGWQLNVA